MWVSVKKQLPREACGPWRRCWLRRGTAPWDKACTGGCCGAATHPVPLSPAEQALPQHPTAPSPRLMIHSCSSEAVNHQSPSPSSESPGCTYACSYLFTMGEAEQLSGCRVRVPRARKVAAAEIPQLFPCPEHGRGAGSSLGPGKGCPEPPLPTQRQGAAAAG